MSDKTTLVVPGKRLSVPRFMKRIVQVAMAVALTSLIVLAITLGHGLLMARSNFTQGFTLWLTFIRRPDIQTITVLTAFVSVLFVYWQRDKEKERR